MEGVARLLGFFERLPLHAALASCAVAVAGLGFVDYATGGEIVLSVFYVMPVALSAWLAGRGAGVALAGAASVAWFIADHFTLMLGWSSWIAWWNGAVRFAFFVIIALIVTALRRALIEERALARQDPLTGVANPRAFRDVLDLELFRAERHGWPITIAYIDVDDFKSVNDRHGHAVGDEVLATIAGELTAGVRRTDTVARLGGDEFAVVLPEADAAVAAAIFERVLAAMRATVASRGWSVTLSVGTVTCDEISQCDPGRSGERLLSFADEAMYEAKLAGKDAVRQRHLETLVAERSSAPATTSDTIGLSQHDD